jgi:hypothetical protein
MPVSSSQVRASNGDSKKEEVQRDESREIDGARSDWHTASGKEDPSAQAVEQGNET